MRDEPRSYLLTVWAWVWDEEGAEVEDSAHLFLWEAEEDEWVSGGA